MGDLAGGNACLKYLVFIFNFLFFLIGCGLLGIGIYAKTGKSGYIDIAETLSEESKYITAGNLVLAVGVIILVVAFLGCCGACMENQCMLLGFFILLSIILILELAAGIYGFVKRDDIENNLSRDFKNAIKNKYMNGSSNSVVNKAIDEFQKKFECCGFDGWLDWKHSDYFTATLKVPKSCCMDGAANCPSGSFSAGYYKKGCFNEVTEWFKNNIIAVSACGVAFAVVQILGLVFSMLLLCAVKRAGEGIMA